jgi:type IX secretion system PorP/SprF family membrane protein
MKRLILILILMTGSFWTMAQDPEFSQYYAAPLNLNPAFAGTGSDHRFISNYRNQWPSITNGFVTYAVSYDYNMADLKSGVGVMIMTDRAGTANLNSTVINLQYAYKVSLGEHWVLSSGLNFGLGNRSIDFNKLVFGDQLEFDSDGGTPSDDPVFSNLQSTTYFDFGGGMLAYNRKFWFGFSAFHLNNPNRSLLNEDAVIPVKTSLHGGVRIPLYYGMFKKDRTAAIMPSFVYKHQGQFDQLDIGTYLLYEPLVFGLWYRGIPIRQNTLDNISQDAVVAVLGFKFQHFEISYSYDVTVSELGPISGGSHELAAKYTIDLSMHPKHKKKQRFIPCPTFIKD